MEKQEKRKFHLHPYCFPGSGLSHQQGMKISCQSEGERFFYIPAEGVTHRHVSDKAVPEDE